MKYHTTQSGFSLVETLVSITILLIVIVGPMKISSQTARSSSFSGEQVTAFFLAQEGIELFEKASDDFLLQQFDGANSNNNPWADISATGLGGFANCYNSTGCGMYLAESGLSVSDCTSGPVVCNLYYDDRPSARSYYIHNSAHGALTPFTRKIFLTAVGPDEIKVVSTVTWRTGFLKSEQQVSVETRKFNVYGNN